MRTPRKWLERAVANPISMPLPLVFWHLHDYVKEIAAKRGGLKGLINLNITNDEISQILTQADFKGYRFDGALAWIKKTLEIIRNLS